MIRKIFLISSIEATVCLLIYFISLIGGYQGGELYLYVGLGSLLFVTLPTWLISKKNEA